MESKPESVFLLFIFVLSALSAQNTPPHQNNF